MENNILALKTYVDGVNDTPFPQGAEEPIEIGSFRYDAKRMGGAPTISMSVYYPSCLDNEWTSKVYAEFNSERYFLKQTPTSSYSNEDARYKHEVELVAERKILDDTYFYDTVIGNPQENDKPVSNDTNFNFYGNIIDFAKRMNASLQYTKLQKTNNDESIQGYHVVVDEGITTEDKHISFDGAVFSQALQESYNTFGIPFYFVGKEIHLGFTNNAISGVLEYGVDDALLSITKQNSNFKVVNRASGKGSTENIPYYYPNNSPKGDIEAVLNTSSEDFSINVFDMDLFSNGLNIDSSIKYNEPTAQITNVVNKNSEDLVFVYTGHTSTCRIFTDAYRDTKADCVLNLNIDLSRYYWEWGSSDKKIWKKADEEVTGTTTIRIYNKAGALIQKLSETQDVEIVLDIPKGESYFDVVINFIPAHYEDEDDEFRGSIILDAYLNTIIAGWYKDERRINLSDIGIVSYNSPSIGDTITQRLVKHVKTSQSLMPSIYRATDGEERFYNAVNYPFDYVDGYELKYAEYLGEDGKVHNDLYKKDDGTYMVFENPYVEGNPKEHVFSVDDLKPTIKGMTNDVFWQDTDENGQAVNVYQRIDMFSEFAYDEGDNDETYTTEDGGVAFKHPYFFAKLRKLDFNLFDHAIENGAMTISMTSGNCGACNFEIGVSDGDEQFNPVQVDENGNLVRDDEGRVLCGLEDYQGPVQPQPKQQDTINNEVWIALKKEEDTYGILMPKAPKYQGETLVEAGHRPKACSSAQSNDGDTFVIININLPEEYILHAERKLEQKIIQYIGENNKEKFNFSITFSRIFLAENPNFLEQLNENARLTIRYNNAEYLLYVSSFSYNMGENDVLPEIRVELDDTLTISQNALQRAIDSVKSEIGQAINALDIAAIGSRYFLRKDVADVAQEPIDFRKGVFFGDTSDVSMYPDGSAKLTIDYLEVTRKATFTSLEIQEKTHAGGQILVSPASMTCSYVEELEDAYRCYFQNQGEDGEETFNTFVVGDQAICQTYNSWRSKFYWRFVSSVGENYIDLSKNDCAPESDVPSIGDKIIQLGNRVDKTRQNAIVIASYGDGSPYIIQYKGINAFELTDDKIVTKLSSTENIFTGKVHMELGSDGLDTLPEWIEVKETAQEALEKAGSIGEEAFAELEQYIEGVRQELQEQIDGAVDSYFEDYEPSTSNYPAIEWNTEEEKHSHLNDTFTNLTDGRSWRWAKIAGNYAWIEIADTATSEALMLAGQAKADSATKMRMFVDTPFTPYSTGDLWSRGESAPLMRCINAKDAGPFNEADWELADNSQAYTDEKLSELNIGGANLLRNSGFTGDYLSEQLADEKVLEGAAELYSSPLDHWSSTATTVIDSDNTISGKAVSLASGTLSQDLYYNTVVGAEYVLSFKAKGEGILSFTIGDASGSVSLTSEMTSYEVVVTPTTSSDTFRISNATCILGNLKLEKGNKATSWSASPLDNASDRAYYQSMKYIQNAFEGATDISGGLVLTEQIQVGDYDTDNKKWVKMNGGMSGVYESDHDVAFWAGGNFTQAINAVMKYDNDPTYQPTEEELADMANFVVTHGGRAILNDAIIRGTVYAQDGEFTGKVIATEGQFTGTINANGGEIGRLKIYVHPYTKATTLSSATDFCVIGFMEDVSITDGNFYASSAYNDTEGVCNSLYETNIDGVGLHCRRPFKQNSLESYLSDGNEWKRGSADIFIEHGKSFDGSETAIKVSSGMFEGLRPSLYVADTVVWLGEYDHTIIIEKSGTTVYLPTSPKVGQRYEIFKQYSASVNIDPQGVQVYSSGSYGGNNGFGTNVTILGTSGFARAVYIYTGTYWFRTIENYD